MPDSILCEPRAIRLWRCAADAEPFESRPAYLLARQCSMSGAYSRLAPVGKDAVIEDSRHSIRKRLQSQGGSMIQGASAPSLWAGMRPRSCLRDACWLFDSSLRGSQLDQRSRFMRIGLAIRKFKAPAFLFSGIFEALLPQADTLGCNLEFKAIVDMSHIFIV
jgi:hypothetical protein